MGYRYYLGAIEKKHYNKIKKLDYNELLNQYGDELGTDNAHILIKNLVTQTLYSFGKTLELTNLKTNMYPFFTNKKTHKNFDNDELWVVDKIFLEKVINDYRLGVLEFYKEKETELRKVYDNAKKNEDNLNESVMSGLARTIKHFEYRSSEWSNEFIDIYDLNDNDEIVKSPSWEYTIFQLMYIYKTFNWKKNHLILYAW